MTQEQTDQAVRLLTAASPVINGLCTLAVGGAAAFVAYRAMKHTAVTGRYKTSLEAYKIAKDAGIATEEDEKWARKSLRLLADDVVEHGDRVDQLKVMRALAMGVFAAWCTQLYTGGFFYWIVWTFAVIQFIEAACRLYRSATVDAKRWKREQIGTPRIIYFWRKLRTRFKMRRAAACKASKPPAEDREAVAVHGGVA